MSGMETAETRLRRLRMRSWRRGTKEMDLILGSFADGALGELTPPELDLYEGLLSENDQDLYVWISRGLDYPGEYAGIIDRISKFHRIS